MQGIKRIKTGTSSTMKHDVDEEASSSSSIESSHSAEGFAKADAHYAASLRRTKRGKMLRAKIRGTIADRITHRHTMAVSGEAYAAFCHFHAAP